MISEDVSIFLTFMMNEILIVDIGNKIIQSRGKQNMVSAVIKSVKSNVKALKTAYPDENSVIGAVFLE